MVYNICSLILNVVGNIHYQATEEEILPFLQSIGTVVNFEYY